VAIVPSPFHMLVKYMTTREAAWYIISEVSVCMSVFGCKLYLCISTSISICLSSPVVLQLHGRSRTCQNNTRNSSGDEIANVNFLYDDIVHVLQNT